MKLIIHRGTKEIGGSCVELKSKKARIIIDLGLPLVNEQGETFDSNTLQDKCVAELVENHVLPPIEGLYKSEQKSVDAVLISHPHQDHYGLLRYVNNEIPVYLSKGAYALIQASNIFIPVKTELQNVKIFENRKSFMIGDIKITPRLVDHSGFDAVAFTIECEGKKLFYSGDFRGHGRKSVLFDVLCRYPEKDVDYLLLEGSMLGRKECSFSSEKAVEDEMTSIFKNNTNVAFVFCSSQNIDRIVSIYRAAKRTGKTTVIDLYTAYILDSIKDVSKHLLQYWWDGIRVFYFQHHCRSLIQSGFKSFTYQVKTHKITIEDINKNKDKYVIITKDNTVFPKLLNRIDNHSGVVAIYSQWEGYLKNNNLQDLLTQKEITFKKIHTSGHAPEDDLKRLVNSFNPKHIIPIHTFFPENYETLFPGYDIKRLNDGEEFIL
ncbi:MAG: MBL fold metallo-hydrolase [Dehalococcoidales bacterium]